AENELIAHELAVILAERAGGRPVARVADVGARCPLPDIAKQLVERASIIRSRDSLRMKMAALKKMTCGSRSGGGCFPFRLHGQTRPGPARKGVGFIVADVAQRFVWLKWTASR